MLGEGLSERSRVSGGMAFLTLTLSLAVLSDTVGDDETSDDLHALHLRIQGDKNTTVYSIKVI